MEGPAWSHTAQTFFFPFINQGSGSVSASLAPSGNCWLTSVYSSLPNFGLCPIIFVLFLPCPVRQSKVFSGLHLRSSLPVCGGSFTSRSQSVPITNSGKKRFAFKARSDMKQYSWCHQSVQQCEIRILCTLWLGLFSSITGIQKQLTDLVAYSSPE